MKIKYICLTIFFIGGCHPTYLNSQQLTSIIGFTATSAQYFKSCQVLQNGSPSKINNGTAVSCQPTPLYSKTFPMGPKPGFAGTIVIPICSTCGVQPLGTCPTTGPQLYLGSYMNFSNQSCDAYSRNCLDYSSPACPSPQAIMSQVNQTLQKLKL